MMIFHYHQYWLSVLMTLRIQIRKLDKFLGILGMTLHWAISELFFGVHLVVSCKYLVLLSMQLNLYLSVL
uniref:Uncharacterized protein n=1 Tax=Cannabis sativa TaxID=3483 RepID=A0A803QUR8_CANSA